MVMVAPAAATEERQEAEMVADQEEDHRMVVVVVVEEASSTNSILRMIAPGARTQGEAVMAGEDLIEAEAEAEEGEVEEITEMVADLQFGWPVNRFNLAILLLIQVFQTESLLYLHS